MKLAQAELEKNQRRNKNLYNRKAKKRSFQAGNKVLVLLPSDQTKLLMQWKGSFEIKGTEWGNNYQVEVDKKVVTYHINMLKLYVEKGMIAETATPVRRNIPGEPRVETQVGCGCVQGVQGGHPQAAAGGQAGTNLVGVKRDVAEEVSVNENDLLGLVTFQSKESIQDVCVGAELNGEQQNEVMEVLRRYEEIFTEIPKRANVIEHTIDLTDDRPIRCKPYPLPYAKGGEIREKIKNMMDTVIVRESSSSYASPLIVVKKKDGSNRMCVDYRKLNLVTVADPAPMIAAENLFGKLRKCQYYLTIDLSKGYWQTPVAEEDIHKIAFLTPDGCYELLRMPFGRKNSGATLVRGMRKLLQDMDNVECYIDNLIVYTKDWATHLQVLNQTFGKTKTSRLGYSTY